MENSIITLTDSEKLYEIIEYFIPHLNYPQIKKMVQNVISQNPNSSMLLSRIIQQIQVEESSHLRNLWISLFPSFYVNNRDKKEDANNPTEENTKERDDALKFIALWSFFNVKQENTLPFCDTIPVDVNPEFRRSCQHVLMNMLKTGCSSPTLEKRLELGISYLHPLVKYLIKLSKSSEFIEPALEEYNIELLTTIKTALTKIKKQDGKNEKLFEFLFLYMSLLIFLEPESSEQLLQDLVECHRRSTGKAEEDDGPHWSQVLMDIMLALLSTEGKVTLYFIHGLFACYLPLVTKDSLQQILEAISPKKDEEDAMEIDEEEGSEDDDEGGESSNEAGKKEEVSFSKMDLMEVDAPDEEEEEEEELLSDSEMFKLDAALAQVISKSRKASKKTKEAEAQKEMSYTLRCLDLLDILFKKESPSAAFAILTIQPLVDAIIANPKSGILLKRVNHLLEQLYKKRKAMKEEVDRNVMKDLIQSLLQSLKKVKQERKHIAVIITQMICLAFYLYEHHVDEYVNPGQFGSYLSAIVQEHATTNSYPTFPILLEKYFQVYNVDPSVDLLQHVIDAIFSSDIRPARRTRLVGSLQRIMKSLKHDGLLRDTYSTEICNKSFKLMETLPATSHVFKEFVVLLYAILDECSKIKLPQDLVDKLGQMKRKLPKDGKLAQRYLLEYHKHNDN